MEPSFSGSCLCGATRFRVEGPTLSFQYCHCSRCRKVTGSAFGAMMFVRIAHFRWEAGEENVRRFELPNAQHFCNAFCTICGSEMPWITRNGKAVAVPAGTLDEDPGVRPARNVYFGSRSPWYVHPSELETFDETALKS